MASVSVMNSEEGKHRLLPKLAPLSAHQQQTGRDGLNVGIMRYGRYIQEPGRETNRRKKNSPRHSAACYRSSSIGLMCVTLQTRLCLNKHISVLSFPCTTLYAYIPSHNQTTDCCFLFRKFAFWDITRFIKDI